MQFRYSMHILLEVAFFISNLAAATTTSLLLVTNLVSVIYQWFTANISLSFDISPLMVFSSSLSNQVELLLIFSETRKFTIDRDTLNSPRYRR